MFLSLHLPVIADPCISSLLLIYQTLLRTISICCADSCFSILLVNLLDCEINQYWRHPHQNYGHLFLPNTFLIVADPQC